MDKKYKKVFIDALSLNGNQKVENIKYNEIDEWDSIGHMTLVSEIESAFNVTFDTDDIVNYRHVMSNRLLIPYVRTCNDD